jgi:hypothetical protein
LEKAFSWPVNGLKAPDLLGGYAYSWFGRPRGLKPKRRPEDQAGLTIRDNFFDLQNRKSIYMVTIVRKRRRGVAGRAWQ